MIHGNTMDLRPEMSIGERIAVARRYAGLTQEALAEQARVNVDTIRKLEQGQRQSARVSTITAIAHALGVTTIAILEGLPSEEEQEDPQLLALRRALLPVSEFVPGADHPEETTLPDITALQESVSDAWSTYHAGDMAALGRIVPRLLDEARVAVREHTNGQWHQANAILVKTYQLGAHVLARGRMEDLALHGLDRARSYAERADDPLLGAMLANSVSWIMMRTGRPDDSEVVAVSAADAIEPKFRSSSPAHISVYGGLLLSAAAAAGRDRRYDTGRELLRVAKAAAAAVGDSTDRWTSVFGPTSVAMQAVQLETAAGEWGKAL